MWKCGGGQFGLCTADMQFMRSRRQGGRRGSRSRNSSARPAAARTTWPATYWRPGLAHPHGERLRPPQRTVKMNTLRRPDMGTFVNNSPKYLPVSTRMHRGARQTQTDILPVLLNRSDRILSHMVQFRAGACRQISFAPFRTLAFRIQFLDESVDIQVRKKFDVGTNLSPLKALVSLLSIRVDVSRVLEKPQ